MVVITKAASRASARRQFFDFDLRLEKMPSLEGYESQLESLFFHLIDNAIQFREPSRKLVIKIDHVIIAENIFRVSKTQYKYVDHLRIFFSDNGMGFPEEYNDYIFVLLKKIHDSTGLGMGLPLVKKIVQKHFGQIRVKSQPQVGTHFEIELPINVG